MATGVSIAKTLGRSAGLSDELVQSLSTALDGATDLRTAFDDWRASALKTADNAARAILDSPTFKSRMLGVQPAQQEILKMQDEFLLGKTPDTNAYAERIGEHLSLDAKHVEEMQVALDSELRNWRNIVNQAAELQGRKPEDILADMRARGDHAGDFVKFTLGAKIYAAMKSASQSLQRSENGIAKFSGHALNVSAEGFKHARWAVPVTGAGLLGAHYFSEGESTDALMNAIYTAGANVIAGVQAVSPEAAKLLSDAGAEAVNGAIIIAGIPSDFTAQTIQTFADRSGLELRDGESVAVAQLISGNPYFAAMSVTTKDGFTADDLSQIFLEAYRSGDPRKFMIEKTGLSGNAYDAANAVALDEAKKLNIPDPAKAPAVDGAVESLSGTINSAIRSEGERVEKTRADFLRRVSAIDLTKDVSAWSGSQVTTAFDIASNNTSSLGLSGFQKGVFSIVSGVAAIASSFSWLFGKEAVQSVQRFALDFIGIEDKLANLKADVENGTVALQGSSGGRFARALDMLGPRGDEPEFAPG